MTDSQASDLDGKVRQEGAWALAELVEAFPKMNELDDRRLRRWRDRLGGLVVRHGRQAVENQINAVIDSGKKHYELSPEAFANGVVGEAVQGEGTRMSSEGSAGFRRSRDRVAEMFRGMMETLDRFHPTAPPCRKIDMAQRSAWIGCGWTRQEFLDWLVGMVGREDFDVWKSMCQARSAKVMREHPVLIEKIVSLEEGVDCR